MRIQVAMKNAGNIRKRVKNIPFDLQKTPATFGELIEETVKASIVAYRKRIAEREENSPCTDEQYAAMQEMGRFVWGFLGEEKKVDESKAIALAKESIADGLVRVFQGEKELTDFSAPLEIKEEDVFTFVKLTMLAGRLW